MERTGRTHSGCRRAKVRKRCRAARAQRAQDGLAASVWLETPRDLAIHSAQDVLARRVWNTEFRMMMVQEILPDERELQLLRGVPAEPHIHLGVFRHDCGGAA